MRDRLIKIVKESLIKNIDYTHRLAENIADDLLAEGIIVPPCKVGQTVYVPWNWQGETGIATPIVECIQIVRDKNLCGFFIDMKSDDVAFNDVYGFWKTFSDIGKTVFLTREEAEKALERRKNGT